MRKRSTVESRESRREIGRSLSFCLMLIACCLLSGCYQPVLESSECIQSRDFVKKFYSFHIGNDMKPSVDNLAKREEFLSSQLKEKLSRGTKTDRDYFTQTENYPKTFRAGRCESKGKDTTKFEVLLFWRTNDKNIQRELEVEAIKKNDKWLVNKVTLKN